jgi:prepilin-type processing-associated H-X9-DG protein
MTTPFQRVFTLKDLIAVMLIGAVLAVAGCVSLGRAREQANRAKCANNLRQIALGAIMYANGEPRPHAFPRVRYDSTTTATVPAFTGMNSPNSFAADGPAANDVSAAMYLILKTQDLTPAVFICPATTAEPWDYGSGMVKEQHSNFPGSKNVSYSFANPYPTSAAVVSGWSFDADTLGADDPLAADANPGGSALPMTPYTASRTQLMAVNSPNHQREGQNVCYCDGHVEFQQTPFCGATLLKSDGITPEPFKDNIYTYGVSATSPGGIGVIGPPQQKGDTVLLPVSTGSIAAGVSHSGGTMGWIVGLLLILILGAVIFTVMLLRQRRSGGNQPTF